MKYEETLFFLSQNIINTKKSYIEQIDKLKQLITDTLTKKFFAEMQNMKKTQFIKNDCLSLKISNKDDFLHFLIYEKKRAETFLETIKVILIPIYIAILASCIIQSVESK